MSQKATVDSSLAKESTSNKDVDIGKYKQKYQTFNENWLNEQNIKIDWIIKERNKYWHDTYFTKRAARAHQAKGNCRFVMNCVEELERQGWINPGDLLLDPMCGIASFLIVGALKGYNGVGIELEEKFYDLMVGFEEHIDIDNDNDLFSSYINKQHIEGNVEKFHRLTNTVPSVGDILILNGDARYDTDKAIEALALDGKNKIYAVSSPPYGNRLSDVTQAAAANDGRTWEELEEESDGRRQYSNDPANIGTHRIAIISSPPYSRSTEHDAKQIEALPEEKVGGHKGFQYQNRKNIALLKIGPYEIEMLKVYKALYRTVGIGSPVVLLTRNFIQEGKMVLLDVLTEMLMMEAGFSYKFTKRAELPEISMFKYMNWNNHHREKKLPLVTWEEATFYLKER